RLPRRRHRSRRSAWKRIARDWRWPSNGPSNRRSFRAVSKWMSYSTRRLRSSLPRMAVDQSSGAGTNKLTGGEILVAALRSQGVDRVYCVPGESYLEVLDALHDTPEIAVVSARHEGAAANM